MASICWTCLMSNKICLPAMKEYEYYYSYFENRLKKEKFIHQPSQLYEPIAYTLQLGGKRIRPVLTLMACELFGGNIEDALPQAMAIELFHNFTLIHDDIMDNAPLRRGKASVFKKWNRNIAILSGDTLFAQAYQFVQMADQSILPDVLAIFNQTALNVCEGQQYDLIYENDNDVSVADYTEMVRLKTAVLFGASLKIGALLGGAMRKDAKNLFDFGVNIGIGFQLKDDLLDTFGDENVFGKKTGNDILSNKKTFLFLKAIEKASPAEKKQLINSYTSEDLTENQKIENVKTIFNKLNIYQLTSDEINNFYKWGMKSLKKVNIGDEDKEKLVLVAHKMIDRIK